MLPLYIRYQPLVAPLQITLGLALLFLSIYSFSPWQILLAIGWISIALFNRKVAILELTDDKIIVKHTAGYVAYSGSYHDKLVEVTDNEIIINDKKVYVHSILYNREEFEQVRTYLATTYPENNLKRHLIDEQ